MTFRPAALLLLLPPLLGLARTDPAAPPPRLSQTGLDRAGRLGYAPQYPLWTDGAEKSRWVWLPPGTRIQAAGDGPWQYPVGTRFWKEFRFGGRKVETRLLWKAAPGRWVFATYRWRDDQGDADLAPAAGVPDAADLGGGVHHRIPARGDCLACHGEGPDPVLGFTALQLSTDRDPLAPHAEPLQPGMLDLRELDRRHLLVPARPDLVAAPPRIEAPTPAARAALGYLAANCGACHGPATPIRGVALDLAQPFRAGWKSPVGQPSRFRGAGGSLLVAPGDPGASVLLNRMRATQPALRMPPLGSGVPDAEGIARVAAWISEQSGGQRAGSPQSSGTW